MILENVYILIGPTNLLLTASVGGALLSTGHVPVGSPVVFNVSSTSYVSNGCGLLVYNLLPLIL